MSDTTKIIIIIASIVAFLLIGGIVSMFLVTMPIAKKLYNKQWVRHGEESFKRGCSDSSVDYHLDMFNQGMEFREKHLLKIKELQIESMGLKLAGEYYDFGFKKAIILLPGRTETALYGAYYAEAFMNGGYNVMLPDPRAHGLSEGDKISLGKYEGIDALNWAKYLHDELGVESIALYGLCGGCTGALVAIKDKDCPDYVNAVIADGMFYSFFRVYRRHIIDEHHPVYPVIWEVLGLIKKHNDVNPYKVAPHYLIKNCHVPILILTGEKDIFAVPKEADKMFKMCPSKDKHIAHIKNARHSHLRYDNKVDYDKAVVSFLKSH